MARRLSIRQQLQDAYTSAHKTDGLTLVALIAVAGLDCSESSLYRKLFEDQTLRAEEIERLARALRIEVTAGRTEAA